MSLSLSSLEVAKEGDGKEEYPREGSRELWITELGGHFQGI